MTETVVINVEAQTVRPIRHQVLRPHQTIEEVTFPGDEAPDTLHAGAFVSGKLVAVASIFRDPLPGDPNDADWRIRGMATLPEFRGRGLGEKLLEACVRHAVTHGARRVWCNARTGASGFYARHGFEKVGHEFDLPDIGPHYRMIRKL